MSTFFAGCFLLLLVLGFGDVIARIPMAALVAVMIMVCVKTFDWHSILPRTLRRMPKAEVAVMTSTMLVTVLSHNLALAVVVGVLVSRTLSSGRLTHHVWARR